MRSTWPALVALVLLAPLGLHAPSLAQTAPAVAPKARVIVKFKSDATVLRQHALSASTTAAATSRDRASALSQRVGIALSGGAMVTERVQVMHARGISSADLAQRLASQPDVEYAEPSVRHQRSAVPNDPRYQTVTISGSTGGPVSGQWYLRAPAGAVRSSINAEAAWDITTGSSSVVVAVLDTGIRTDHNDLSANLLPGYDFVSEDDTNIYLTANDGNGRDNDPSDPGDWVSPADIASGNFDGCQEEDSSWHGTQTASLVSAVTNNGIGMASVGRTLSVVPVRVLGKCGGYTDDIAAGIRWAAGLSVPGVPANAHPAKVINMSLGGSGGCSQVYRDAIAAAVNAGVVVVVSAGNSNGHAVSQPANCPGAVAVTGLRHVGTKVGFADVGTQAAIAAPGGNCVTLGAGAACQYAIITATNSGATTPVVNSSVYTDAFNAAVGTSFSAPMVAGTVGLMFSLQPTLSVADARTVLQGSARVFPNTGGTAGIAACRTPDGTDQDECYCTTTTCGAGMLDASAAVAAIQRGVQGRISLSTESPRAAQALTLSGTGSYVLSPRSLSTYQWSLVDGGGIVTTLGTPTAATATATPTGAGRFTVSLTVTDSTGAQSTTTRAIDVDAALINNSGGGGGGGGGALGLPWLAGLALATVALQLLRNRQARAKSMLERSHRR